MNSVDLLTEIYKPLRVTLNKSVKIFDTMDGKFIVKKKEKDINELFNYLKSRNFHNVPKLIDGSRSDVLVYEYIDTINEPIEQQSEDLIRLIASLHNKTAYFKEVTNNVYKEIYDNIKNNILYSKSFYISLFDELIIEEFMSPSSYLFVRNYSSINNALLFCESELDKWYDLVKEKNKQRVCLLHNNLELDHYLKGDLDYLVSWEKSRVDTPVWDIVMFYKKHYYDLEFSTLLNIYLDEFSLNEDELKLLYILIAMPGEIVFSGSEYDKTEVVRKQLDYIFKSEALIRPYYSKEKENK